jgi:hypothetical protein
LVGAWNAINATLYDNLSFNIVSDIVSVAGIMRVPHLMLVNPSFPAKTVPEFIAYAKGNPGKVNMASAGTGSTPHVSGELFNLMAGVKLVHVPYRGGGPALADLIAGQVQVMFESMPSSIEYVRAGRLRALAVTATARSEALPDVPILADFVPGYEASAPQGMAHPRTRPRRSSTSSTGRSMPPSLTRGCRRGLPIWAVQCSPARPPISASSWPKKLKNGARSFRPPTSSRSNPRNLLWIFHSCRTANPTRRNNDGPRAW